MYLYVSTKTFFNIIDVNIFIEIYPLSDISYIVNSYSHCLRAFPLFITIPFVQFKPLEKILTTKEKKIVIRTTMSLMKRLQLNVMKVHF